VKLAQRIDALFGEYGEYGAVLYEDEWTSWAELGAIRDAIQKLLAEAGVDADAAVGVVLRERPASVGALLALFATGRSAVPITPIQPDGPMCEEVTRTRLAALVAHRDDWARPGLVAVARSVGTVGLELTGDRAAPVRFVPALGMAGPGPHHKADTGVALTIPTSGTTGPPKRIPISWEQLDAMGGGPDGRDAASPATARVMINSLPLVSIGGCLAVVGAAWAGRPLALLERFDVQKWAALIRDHQPRRAGAPPAVIQMVLQEQIPKEWFASVRSFFTASAPLDPAIAVEFERRYGIPVLQGYGSTEFLGGVAAWTLDDWEPWRDTKLGSVGRAMPGVGLRVVDPDDGRVLGTDEVGVLEVEPVQRPAGAPPGWMRTTDLARLDEDGFLWLYGRVDDVINRGGFKVPIDEVERVLLAHPGVAEAVVVGLDDPRLGHVPAAAVVPRTTNGAPPDASELLAWARERLAPYKVPVTITFVDRIPRNPMMKAQRTEVRELHTRGG
jgi:acyl-coenzyme A synthetase/AMP-(fatty) acid ligase